MKTQDEDENVWIQQPECPNRVGKKKRQSSFRIMQQGEANFGMQQPASKQAGRQTGSVVQRRRRGDGVVLAWLLVISA